MYFPVVRRLSSCLTPSSARRRRRREANWGEEVEIEGEALEGDGEIRGRDNTKADVGMVEVKRDLRER